MPTTSITTTRPDIVTAVVSKHPTVLDESDCVLADLDNKGINISVEICVDGIVDGENKYTSKLRFPVWNALKEVGFEKPFQQWAARFLEGHAPKG